MSKKIKSIICWTVIIVFASVAIWFLCVFFGNPISGALARRNSSKFLEENFGDSHFQITNVGYNFKTGGYFAKVESPISPDSYFTIYLDGWGQYHYDTYESVTDGTTTFARLNQEYRELVKNSLPYDRFDISIGNGELRAAGYFEVFNYTNASGEVMEYTLWKDYGLDMSTLTLDGDYDIRDLGRSHGSISLYIHDTDVSVERAAELLLALKAHLDEQGVPFHAIDFHLCEPRNELGQNVGQRITLHEFLYSDIYKEGLTDRVQQYWNAAQEHSAIQSGEKANSELQYLEKFEIPKE